MCFHLGLTAVNSQFNLICRSFEFQQDAGLTPEFADVLHAQGLHNMLTL